MSLANYPNRHLDPALAAAYREKFRRSWVRRLSARREARIVARAVTLAIDWLVEHGTARDHVTLLDYPCGAGRFSVLAARQVEGYIAADHSPHMVKLTEAALAEAGLTARLRGTSQGDARQMNLAADAADVSLCMRLLHHFGDRADRIRILSELRRVTRGPLVTSYLDASAWKQRRHVARLARAGKTSRRVLLSPTVFAEEALAAGWRTITSWPLSSWFSGQRVAVCCPSESRAKSAIEG